MKRDSAGVNFEAEIVTARLAQSVEHETLNLRVVGSSPTLGANFFFFIKLYMFRLVVVLTVRNHPGAVA